MEAENGPTPRRGGPGLWGILTAAVAVVTVGLCGWYTLIFVNPYSPLNPLPPADFTFDNGTEVQTLDPAKATGNPENRMINGLFEGLLRQMPPKELKLSLIHI